MGKSKSKYLINPNHFFLMNKKLQIQLKNIFPILTHTITIFVVQTKEDNRRLFKAALVMDDIIKSSKKPNVI